MGTLTFYFCPYTTIAAWFYSTCVTMCKSRMLSVGGSSQQLTAGQTRGCQNLGFEMLRHSFSCPVPPATALTASQSPVWSFKVLAKLLTGQSLEDECSFLLGRSKIAPTFFFYPSTLVLQVSAYLKNSLAEVMSFPWHSKEPTAALHLSCGHPWNLQGGCWKTDVVRRVYGSPLADMIYILMERLKTVTLMMAPLENPSHWAMTF